MRSALLGTLAVALFTGTAAAQYGTYPYGRAYPYYAPTAYARPGYVAPYPVYSVPSVPYYRYHPTGTPTAPPPAPSDVPASDPPAPLLEGDRLPAGPPAEPIGPPLATPMGKPPTYTPPPPASTPAATLPAYAPPATAGSYTPVYRPELEPDDEPVVFHREPCDRWWVSGNVLNGWFSKSRYSTPLVTIGTPLVGPPPPAPGAIGSPGTVVLDAGFGNLNYFTGLRLAAGVFLGCDNRFSLDVAGFGYVPREETFVASSNANGNPLIARPIFDTDEGRESSIVTSFPGQFSGSTSVESKIEHLGLEFNGRYHAYKGQRSHWQALTGLRYLRLKESQRITDNLNPLVAGVLTFELNPVDPPNREFDQDFFGTRNDFFGLQFGGEYTYETDRFNFSVFGKLALGATDQRISVAGSTAVITPAGVAAVTQGGVLALATNIGDHDRSVFSVVPELGLNMDFLVCKHVRIMGGYSLLMWSNVVRPPGQIDRAVSRSLIPSDQTFGAIVNNQGNPVTPAPPFVARDEFFWVHAFNLGLEFRY